MSLSAGAAQRVDELPVLNVLIASGICLLLWFVFQQHTFDRSFLTYIGRHSLEVYVLHCFFTAGFRALFPRLGISNAYISVGLNTVLSTMIPLGFAMLCVRLGIRDCFFRPVSWARRIKCAMRKAG